MPNSLPQRVLINVPHLSVRGGVTNYFNAIKLPDYGPIAYFYVNQLHDNGWLSKISFLLLAYGRFLQKAARYDLVHLNVSFNFKSYYRDMGFMILLKLLGKKGVVFFHGWDTTFEQKISGSRWQRALFRATYGRMDACIVLGRIYQTKVMSLGIKPACKFYTETTVADNSFMRERATIEHKFKASPCVNVLFLARILEQKGVYIALKAYQKLKSQLSTADTPRITLTIAGDGPELERVKTFVARRGIANVTFSGYVQGSAKHQVLTTSHILLFPTYYPEGQPCVNLEAMLYGMPVITRAIAGIPDLLTHGENGFLTSATEPDTFADLLGRLVTDLPLRHTMGRRNHQRAVREFVPSRVVPRILTIYRETLAASAVSAAAVPTEPSAPQSNRPERGSNVPPTGMVHDETTRVTAL